LLPFVSCLSSDSNWHLILRSQPNASSAHVQYIKARILLPAARQIARFCLEKLSSLIIPYIKPSIMSEADLTIPKGYIKQVLGERTTKYIKGSVLRKWVNERKKEFGTRWNFVVCLLRDSYKTEC
jgi:hypothetical protein